MQGRGVEDRPGQSVGGEDGDHGESFGAMLRRLRETAGLTQGELASRAGVTVERATYEPLVTAAREALGDEAFADAWAEGRKLPPERALDSW